MDAHSHTLKYPQQGTAAVEFALVAVVLLALIFGIIEFGRLFFTLNSVQEITRRAAREQVVNWVSSRSAVQRVAVLRTDGGPPGTVNFPNASGGTANFPGSLDIQNTHVQLNFLRQDLTVIQPGDLPVSSQDNVEKCLAGESNCIKFVQAELVNADGSQLDFKVIAPYLPVVFSIIRKPDEGFMLPRSTVIMPAEALGLL